MNSFIFSNSNETPKNCFLSRFIHFMQWPAANTGNTRKELPKTLEKFPLLSRTASSIHFHFLKFCHLLSLIFHTKTFNWDRSREHGVVKFHKLLTNFDIRHWKYSFFRNSMMQQFLREHLQRAKTRLRIMKMKMRKFHTKLYSSWIFRDCAELFSLNIYETSCFRKKSSCW